jgi:hypothetical protein
MMGLAKRSHPGHGQPVPEHPDEREQATVFDTIAVIAALIVAVGLIGILETVAQR